MEEAQRGQMRQIVQRWPHCNLKPDTGTKQELKRCLEICYLFKEIGN